MVNNPEFYSAAAGIVMPMVVDWLKNAEWFKWVQADKSGQVKALAAVLAGAAALLTAWQTGNLSQDVLTSFGSALYLFSQTLGLSALIHHWVLKPKAPELPEV